MKAVLLSLTVAFVMLQQSFAQSSKDEATVPNIGLMRWKLHIDKQLSIEQNYRYYK